MITNPAVLIAAGLVLVFISFALFVYAFVPDEVEEEEIYGYRERKRQRLIRESPIYKVTLPLVKIFAHYIRKIDEDQIAFVSRLRKQLREKLPRSGYMGAYSPDEFLGMCCTTGVGFFVFVVLFTTWINGTPAVAFAIILGLASLYFPFLKLDGAIQERLIEIDQRLPYTMDLLVLSMNAGLDFMQALERVVERGKEQNPDNPMIQELSVVLQELQVGTPRADALKNLCERVKSDYLDSMVGSIIQAEERGTPLAKVLKVQVDTIRNKRTQRVEKEASEAAVKMLMPLMFIFGAVVVVVRGAMILRIMTRGS
ncbi:MAG: type II secretion system F family protein [Bradymonadaceae bacterium]